MNKLNVFLANLAVLNTKLHNLHWNVTGSMFMPLHTFTESLYEQAFSQFDEVAEILKMQGIMPMVKLSDYAQTATIKELDAKEFKAEEVLKIVESDIQEMVKLAKEIRADAADHDNFQVANQFEDYLTAYAKNLWFISATLK